MTQAQLKKALSQLDRRYPGEPSSRQPVHTVYGGAQLFAPDTFSKLTEGALQVFEEFAPTPESLEVALTGVSTSPALWREVHLRVKEKLKREAVEDFRIDFEDGYGNRSDAEEDKHAETVGQGLASFGRGIPPFIGIRIKPLSLVSAARSERTLEVVLKNLGKRLPPGFRVTLPKVIATDQIRRLVALLEQLEKRLRLPRIGFEFMVETPQSLMDLSGKCPLLDFVKAGKGRCIGTHFGTYDYTASHNIVAIHQHMLSPACAFAKQVMKIALSGSGIFISDGATNVMPVGIHKDDLSVKQREENRLSVHRAWRLSFEAITESLRTGFYQGWDLHPAQIPVRFAAVYAFFVSSREASTQRLKGFMEKAARATLLGDVFDDAATGQGLLNFFLRGRACGALTESEVLVTGLTEAEVATRSFSRILEMRKHLA